MSRVLIIAAILAFLSCQNPSTTSGGGESGTVFVGNTGPSAKWIKAPSAYTNDSSYYSMAKDSSGNLYCVGYFKNVGPISFGGAVSATGQYTGENAVLVKYDSSGVAQWARALSTDSDVRQNYFRCVAVKSNDDVCVLGTDGTTGNLSFGNGVTIADPNSGGSAFIATYSPVGNALSAWSLTASGYLSLPSMSLDSAGNVYVSAQYSNTSVIDFGNSVTVTGCVAGNHPVFVKYSPAGVAQWARSTISETGGTPGTWFNEPIIDSSFNVFLVGYVQSITTYDFGNSITLTGTATGTGSNPALIKLNPSGVPQFAKTIVAGGGGDFHGGALDSNGNIIVVGNMLGNRTLNFGNGVTLSDNKPSGYPDAFVAKFDSNGMSQWAKLAKGTYITGGRIVVSNTDDIYASFLGYSSDIYDFGNGVKNNAGCTSGNSGFLVKYDQTGKALWSNTSVSGNEFNFQDLVLVGSNIFVAGQTQKDTDFGNGVITPSASGFYKYSTLLKY